MSLEAGPPLEPPSHKVGHRSSTLVDAEREGRVVPVDAWYPAENNAGGTEVTYEILPGVGFTAAAVQNATIASGHHPLVLWSHGRTGTRSSYVLFCEALAARGFIVLAPEHAGDALADWIIGAAVDDATNEANRIGDAHFVLNEALGLGATVVGGAALSAIAPHVDADRVAAMGHSYGGFTALAIASGATAHPNVRAVAGMQSFTRSLPKTAFESIAVPTMLVVGLQDTTTPPETDADRAWAKLGAEPAWRVDVERAGHQACSDVGLYLEVAPSVPDVPDLVRAFVASMAADVTGTAGDPWRETVALHVRIAGAFLQGALGLDAGAAERDFAIIGALDGVAISSRGTFAATAA